MFTVWTEITTTKIIRAEILVLNNLREAERHKLQLRTETVVLEMILIKVLQEPEQTLLSLKL